MSGKYFVITLILAVLVTACGTPAAATSPVPTDAQSPMPAATVTPDWAFTATDALGRQVTLSGVPERIVSLAPSTTEILFAVGAGSQVVGRDSFSDYPPEAAKVNDIGGGLGNLNTEAILALKPDLVLAAELTSADQIKAIQNLGLTVFVLPNPKDFDGLYADLDLVGRMTGHPDVAAGLVEKDKARVAAVESKLSGVTEKPLVFYELDGTDPSAPWTPGPDTFINTLIDMAGGRNVGASLKGAWVQISVEDLIVQNPDIILLGDATWGGMTPEMVAARAGWDSMPAVQKGHVYPFDDNLVSRPGPRLVDGLEALSKEFHPDLFK